VLVLQQGALACRQTRERDGFCEYGEVERPDTRAIWNANASAWIELTRGGFDVYRDLVNTPAFFELLPPIDGLWCLELGCGEGHNTRLLADRGAHVVALDIAEAFVQAANERDRRRIRYVIGDGAVLPFPRASFDVVTAFMSLMDVADPEGTLVEITEVLRPGGFTQFSVVHPTTSTPIRRWVDDDSGIRHALAVGDYFHQGPVTETWSFSAAPPEVRDRHRPFTVTYARRTLAGWLNAVIAAGLVIEAVHEPHADEQIAAAHPEVADTRIVPYFLHICTSEHASRRASHFARPDHLPPSSTRHTDAWSPEAPLPKLPATGG
jgi:SAM-dependent methyltransferase